MTERAPTTDACPGDAHGVRLDEVEFAYRSGWRLGPLSLDVPTGVTALIGPNGAGKSTLIRVLVAAERPKRGELRFEGARVAGRGVDGYRRRVGHLPQDARWDDAWSVADYVDFVAQAHGVPRKACAEARAEALRSAGASDVEGRRLGSLSGGRQQRVHLATAIVHDPDVLVLDEPTAGLDPAERIRVRSFVKEQGASRAILLSTHLMDDVAMAADAIAVMRDGKILWSGSTSELEARGSRPEPGQSRAEAGYLAAIGA